VTTVPAPQPDRPGLTSAQERAVRELLAGARHTDQLPDDVAERLDATLGDLAAERAAEPVHEPVSEPVHERLAGAGQDPTVVPLARRRRRRFGIGLAAAAAIVVGGVAVSEVLPQPSGEDAATSEVAGGGESRDADGPEAGLEADQPAEDSVASAQAEPRLSPDTFRRDVRRARRLVVAGLSDRATVTEPRSGDTDSYAGDEPGQGDEGAGEQSPRPALSAAGAYAEECGLDAGPGRLVLVRYAGERALLVLRPVRDGRQRADLYGCGATEPIRSVTLPVR
jgi:hypothetical protein